MMATNLLQCDGCGQPASAEHIAKRLQRLEWSTRHRPIHIGTLFLSAVAPANDGEFLYAGSAEFAGMAKHLLDAAGVAPEKKPPDVVLAEFQRGGNMLAYLLDCPLDRTAKAAVEELLALQLSGFAARVRRSLRPKRVVPISLELEPIANRLEAFDLGCPIILDAGKPFALDAVDANEAAIGRLRQALSALTAAAR